MAQQQAAPTQDELVRALYTYAADKMKRRWNDARIIKEMGKQGVPENVSRTICANLRSAQRDASKQNAGRDMAVGAAFFVIGILITVGTYAMASDGGTYFVTYGAIIFGGIQFLRGLINSAR